MKYIYDDLRDKNILITGGAGFIGSNIAHYLNKYHGESRVFIFDKFRDGDAFGNQTSLGHFKNIAGFRGEVIVGDLANKDDLAKLDKYKFDYIFHEGAICDTTCENQALVIKTNYESLDYFISKIKESEGVLIYASSAAVYGNSKAPNIVGEGEIPENVYGFSKLLMDMKLRETIKNSQDENFKIIALRYFNVYGLGEYHKGAMASMILQLGLQALRDKKVRLFEHGEQMRDFVYIKDVVEANIKAIEASKSGIYNVGSGVARSFNDVVDILKSYIGDFEVEYIKNPYTFYQNHTKADISTTMKDLFYEPRYTLESGIGDYIDEIKNQAKIQKALINDSSMKASLQALFVYMSYTNANQVNISEANQETLNRLIDKAQNNPEAFTEQDLETIKNILKESNTNNNPNVNTEQNTTTNTNTNTNNNNNNDDDNNGGNPPTNPPTTPTNTNANTNTTNKVEEGEVVDDNSTEEENNENIDDDDFTYTNWKYKAEEARKEKEEASKREEEASKREEEARKKTLPIKARVKAKLTREEWDALSQEQKDKYIQEYIEKYEKNNNNSNRDNTSDNTNRKGSSKNRYKNIPKGYTSEEWNSFSKEEQAEIIQEEEARKEKEEARKEKEEASKREEEASKIKQEIIDRVKANRKNNNRKGSSVNRYKDNKQNNSRNSVWEQFGFTKDEWDSLSEDDRKAGIDD